MRNQCIQADIIDYLSDGKKHTMLQMSSDLEISRSTVIRHINNLSVRYNIQTYKGGIDRGGVQLIPEQKVSVEKLSSDDLQLIISTLSSLQDDNVRIKAFVHKLSTQKEIKERNYEN